MRFFIVACSFAAPFTGDRSTAFVEAKSPGEALEKFNETYKHPCGLYRAAVYRSADDYHLGVKSEAAWLHGMEQPKDGQ